MQRVVKYVLLGLGVLFLGLAAVGLGRLVWPQSLEDELHLVAKAGYLDGLKKVPVGVRRPNIVLILFDDMGYGDIGAYGSRSIQTPNLDALAAGGARFSNYYAPAPQCTPSRAGLLTGRLPQHTSLTEVTFPRNSAMDMFQRLQRQPTRLPRDEILLPEILKGAGYATKMVGKWHLGDFGQSLPNAFGFDEYFGVHYSNDMTPLTYYRNDAPAESEPVDQHKLTATYTREAVDFIGRNKAHPFFLYLAHNFPHVPLHSSQEQAGKSDGGLYGDVVEDLDRSIGAVVAALRANGLEENTLILVSSDNGPWFQGSPGAHRGRKNDSFDGGMAVPFIASWPKSIPSGRVLDGLASGLDVVPTVLDLLGLPAPGDRQSDGVSMAPMLLQNGASRRQSLYYGNANTLYAVRDGRFKYQTRRMVELGGVEKSKVGLAIPMGPWLFDLKQDAEESYDVSGRHGADMQRLGREFQRQEAALASNPRGWRH